MLFHLFTKFDHPRLWPHSGPKNKTFLLWTKDDPSLLFPMARFTFIATVATFVLTAVARNAAIPELCCPLSLSACKAKGAPGCVYLSGQIYCVQENSDQDCYDACNSVTNTNRNYFLYSLPRVSSRNTIADSILSDALRLTLCCRSLDTCFCTRRGADSNTDPTCIPT